MLKNYPEGDRSRILTVDNILAYEYEGIASMPFVDLLFSSFSQVCYIIFEPFQIAPRKFQAINTNHIFIQRLVHCIHAAVIISHKPNFAK
jgi:hypothetical protein